MSRHRPRPGLPGILAGRAIGLFALAGSCLGSALVGVAIGVAGQRARTARRLQASEQATREAIAETHAYAERQRLARETHHVLAHTLSGQLVGLEAARMLISKEAPLDAILDQVEQARRMARDGLEETRRAVRSLR